MRCVNVVGVTERVTDLNHSICPLMPGILLILEFRHKVKQPTVNQILQSRLRAYAVNTTVALKNDSILLTLDVTCTRRSRCFAMVIWGVDSKQES